MVSHLNISLPQTPRETQISTIIPRTKRRERGESLPFPCIPPWNVFLNFTCSLNYHNLQGFHTKTKKEEKKKGCLGRVLNIFIKMKFHQAKLFNNFPFVWYSKILGAPDCLTQVTGRWRAKKNFFVSVNINARFTNTCLPCRSLRRKLAKNWLCTDTATQVRAPRLLPARAARWPHRPGTAHAKHSAPVPASPLTRQTRDAGEDTAELSPAPGWQTGHVREHCRTTHLFSEQIVTIICQCVRAASSFYLSTSFQTFPVLNEKAPPYLVAQRCPRLAFSRYSRNGFLSRTHISKPQELKWIHRNLMWHNAAWLMKHCMLQYNLIPSLLKTAPKWISLCWKRHK